MRKYLGVCLLVLLISGAARAGEMPNDKPAPPPQTQTSAIQEPTGGEMHTPGASESLTQIVLELLSVLPSLL